MKKKVLVCDDDPAVCEIISAMLRDAGYEVQEAHDGAEALDDLKHGRYDVMILDYLLGKTNGLDILQKACQVDHEVRIIMISGYQSSDLPKRAKELGASPVVRACPKTFSYAGTFECCRGKQAQRHIGSRHKSNCM